ncbi:hypothetical protein BD309DRAFT_670215 [Dichomitus squalens]|nr:hypothetical protein BD309DRAFT_670215 [Dichomitus squalens]
MMRAREGIKGHDYGTEERTRQQHDYNDTHIFATRKRFAHLAHPQAVLRGNRTKARLTHAYAQTCTSSQGSH